MCGICGFVKLKDNSPYLSEKYLLDMNQTMFHRGPDGGGAWLEERNRAGLGHRRLSIVDLSAAAFQPMSNEDGSVWISFNGEIYNHAEIRRELETSGGHVWKTSHSDTEMIIHAYEQWGIGCLERFRGMFAIALWDGREGKMYLIRDRIGIKPVYYTVHNETLTFASEIKAILKVVDRKPAINEKALYDFLSFLTTPAEDTLFTDIHKLRPGTWLCVDHGKITQHQYWDVWDHTRPEIYKASEDEIKEALLSELRTAVKLRKEADVPVGVFLSGGIDSSTNVALFSEGEKGNVKTFTIGYDRDYVSYQNETEYARMMAEYSGAEYHERLLTQEDLFAILPEMVRLQDEPIADPVCVPVYYVSKLARDNGVIVSQVGEGSDELFWGYEKWKDYLRLAQLNSLPFTLLLKKAGLLALQHIGKSRGYYYERLRRGILRQPLFWSGADSFYETEKRMMLSTHMVKRFSGYTSFEALRPTWERFNANAWEKSHLNWMTYTELRHRLPELLLMRVDKMSMGVSLECRVPFLDHKFVELAMSIPEKIKTKNYVSKYILKQTVRGLIPDELIDRKKQGFGVPVYDWFSGRLGGEMRREVLNFSNQTGFFDTAYIKTMFDNPHNGYRMWFLFNLALWWKEYILKLVVQGGKHEQESSN